MQGWFLVRPLGRQLYLWNERCSARPRNRFARNTRILQARGQLAPQRSESGRKLWRIALELRRACNQGAGNQHRFANGLGTNRPAGERRDGRSRGCQSRELLGPSPASRRLVERAGIHWHGFSWGLLLEIPPLPEFFPGLRPRALFQSIAQSRRVLRRE